MKLVIAGTDHETLMFRLLGISRFSYSEVTKHTESTLDDSKNNNDENLSQLLGGNEPIPLDSEGRDSLCYVRLPDANNPDQETQRLCRMLAQAVGQKEIHL